MVIGRSEASDSGVGATRLVYDDSAGAYAQWAGLEIGSSTEASLDQEVLVGFCAEVVGRATVQGGRHRPSAPASQSRSLRPLVADLGCGPGRAAAFVARHGCEAVGFDLAPAMVAIARRAHPTIGFGVADLAALPLPTATLDGVVAWYSIIHTPPRSLARAFTEMRRVLGEGGYALLAFQSGVGEVVRRERANGTGHTLTSYRHDVATVTRVMADVGFAITSVEGRGPELGHETTPQSFVTARVVGG